MAVSAGALGVLGTFASRQARGLAAMAALAAVAAVVFLPLEALATESRAHLVAPALVLVVALITAAPFFRRDTERTWPWLASALAGVVAYYPLQLAWEEQLGTAAIGLLPIALGLVSLAAAVQVKRALAGDERRLAAYVIAATLFACVAVPVQLEGQWVVLGWSLEAAVLAWLSGRLRHPGVKVFAVALAGLACGRLVMDLHVEQLTLTYVVLGASLLLTAWLLDREEPFTSFPVTRALRFAAVVVFFVQLNLEVDRLFDLGAIGWSSNALASEMTRSLAWAAFGAGLLALGVRSDSKYTRLLAMGILVLAAGKVFFVDLWDLAGMWRVGSVVGAALTLIGSAVLLQKVVLQRKPSVAA